MPRETEAIIHGPMRSSQATGTIPIVGADISPPREVYSVLDGASKQVRVNLSIGFTNSSEALQPSNYWGEY